MPDDDDDLLGNDDEQDDKIDIVPVVPEEEVDEEDDDNDDELDNKDKDDDESDDDNDDEKDSKDEDDEDEDEDVEELPLTASTLRKTYPKIDKQFPELIERLERAEKLGDVFDSAEDATAAKKRADDADNYDKFIKDGDVAGFLNLVANLDKSALGLMIHNFAPTLFRVNREIYNQFSFPVVMHTLQQVKKFATSSQNKNMLLSVNNVIGKLTGKTDIPDIEFNITKREKSADEPDPIVEKAQKSFETNVSSEARRRLEPVIKKQFWDRLPYNEAIKKVFLEKLHTEVNDLMMQDGSYRQTASALYEQVQKAGFFPENSTTEKMLKLYTQRFQTLMAMPLRRLLKEAGVDLKKKEEEDDEDSKKKKKLIGKPKDKDKDKNSEVPKKKAELGRIPSVKGDSDWLLSRMNAGKK